MIVNEYSDKNLLNLITIEFDKHRKIKKRSKDVVHHLSISDRELEEMHQNKEARKKKRMEAAQQLMIITYDHVIYPSYLEKELYKIYVYYGHMRIGYISINHNHIIRSIKINSDVRKLYDGNIIEALKKFYDQEIIYKNTLSTEGIFAHLLDLENAILRIKSVYKNDKYDWRDKNANNIIKRCNDR